MCVYIYIYGTEVEIVTPTAGMPSAAAGLSVDYFVAQKSAAFPSLHVRSRKEIFSATFKSVDLIILYFFNYTGLKLCNFKLRQLEGINKVVQI